VYDGRFVIVNGARFSVCDVGSGPAILFLHGNLSRWQHWGPQLEALASRYRCIAFDQRGYGASTPLRGTSLSLMADDTAALCAALGVEHAYVVGLSMGGAVAEFLALLHPALVNGLVTAGPPLLDGSGQAPELTKEALRPFVLAAFSPAMQAAQPALVARVVEECLETDLDTLRHFAPGDMSLYEPAGIAVPTLVAAGELDLLAPPGPLRGLAEKILGAEFLEIPGAGHWMNLEAPEVFNAAIERFMAAHPMAR
jgi:pimeloyl-ACP methyl ester carboxylesterase